MRWLLVAVLVSVGLLFVTLRRRLARYFIHGQNQTWGFSFGERERVGAERALIVMGLALFVAALLTGLGIIPVD